LTCFPVIIRIFITFLSYFTALYVSVLSALQILLQNLL